ncbi:MAG: hypothetical protein H3C71_08515 [Flavobacteriales bacterium]|nr:hypothetical protein [Flavobacteriales bacterium]
MPLDRILSFIMYYGGLLYLCLSPWHDITAQYKFPYQLNNPHQSYTLPEELLEISGIVALNTEHIACVQDEWGVVFIYNLSKQSVTATHRFDSIGDFEGIAYDGSTLFVLRSDGRITIWRQFDLNHPSSDITHHTVPLQTVNNEGLCYDFVSKQLFIGSKSRTISSEKKEERLIYALDPNTLPLKAKITFRLSAATIGKAASVLGIEDIYPYSDKPFRFRTSAIGIHPISKDIYLLSASDHLLAVLDRNGVLRYAEKLDPLRFPQAEGITFLPDGRMLISNEGKNGGNPTILVFNSQ